MLPPHLTTQPPQQLWRKHTPYQRNTSRRLSGKTSTCFYCDESVMTALKLQVITAVKSARVFRFNRNKAHGGTRLIILTDNNVLSIEDLRYVLITYVISRVQWILDRTNGTNN